MPGPEDTVTGVPQREGHMSTCGGGAGGSNPGHFEEARPVTQQKWCIHPTHYPLARKSTRRKAGGTYDVIPIWSPIFRHSGEHQEALEKTVNSKDQVYGAAVWSPEPSVKESRVQV